MPRAPAQSAAEYGLLLAGIVLVILLGVHEYGDQIAGLFMRVAAAVTTTGR